MLENVYWLGGPSGAGKTTIARRLATEHGLGVYSTDDVMADHVRRTKADESPALAAFIAMNMDERWLHRSPKTMLDTFHWFRGEGFDFIVEDLHAMADGPVIAEGFRLLPHLVAPRLAAPHRAVWLLPTPEFRRLAFESRGSTWSIAGRTSNPERALRNLLERDRMFTDRLDGEIRHLGLTAIQVDTTTTEEDLVREVTRALGL